MSDHDWGMMVVVGLIVSLIGSVVLALVIDSRPVVGTVVEREFYPAHYESGTRTSCVPQPDGKTICYPVSHTEWKPDAWWLRTCKDVEASLPKYRKCRWRQVSKELYDHNPVGDWYDEREEGR